MIPPFLLLRGMMADFAPIFPVKPASFNGFFDNLKEFLQPNMSFEEIAENFSPKVNEIFKKCQQEDENFNSFTLKISAVAKKSFRLTFIIYDKNRILYGVETSSPPMDGEFWLNPASWATLQEEKEKILIEKKISVEKSSEKKI